MAISLSTPLRSAFPLALQELDIHIHYRPGKANNNADALSIAQRRQKQQHDRLAKDPGFKVGERVFVYMPAAEQGEAYRLAKKFRGPFYILAINNNGLELAS